MSRNRDDRLSDEDKALWERVARSTNPMERPQASNDTVQANPTKKLEPTAPADWLPKDFRIGEKASSPTHPGSDFQGQPGAPRMDKRTFQKMRRGKSKPQARIDLHGMTLAVAHPALTAFVFKSHAAGHRLLLVITGKGRSGEDDGPIPERRGILRRQVPQWLTTPPLSSVVLQVEPAHQRHGGGGAYYVYLRRR